VLLVLGLAGALGAGCSDDDDEPPRPNYEGPWASFAERPCPPESILTYASFGGPFMLNYCTGCHSSHLAADSRQAAPPTVNFDTLEDVRRQAERIWVRAGDHNVGMPPVGGPKAEERRRLGEWLACGAPGKHDGIITGTGPGGGPGGGGPQGCDATGSCDACIQCRAYGQCSYEIEACQDQAPCAAIFACVDLCPPDDPSTPEDEAAACNDKCAADNPRGVALFHATLKCILCDDCAALCASASVCAP
jgi:hypothetical protein